MNDAKSHMSDDSPMLLPSMSRDKTKADQLAPSHLALSHHRAAFSTPALCGVRWSFALGQAVAIG